MSSNSSSAGYTPEEDTAVAEMTARLQDLDLNEGQIAAIIQRTTQTRRQRGDDVQAPPHTSGTASVLNGSAKVDLSVFNENAVKAAPYKLPILNDDNFRDWSQSIKRFLKGRKLWCIVDGSLRQPTNDLVKAENYQAYADFVGGILHNSATNTQRAYISLDDNVTPKQIYDTWSNLHSSKAKGRLIPLLTRVLNWRYERGQTVDKVASEMKRTNEQVGQIKNEVMLNDMLLGLSIINAFSNQSRFKDIITHIRSDDDFSSEKVIQRLKMVEQDARDGPAHTHSARISQEKSNARANVQCYGCKEYGHIERNCHNKQDDSANESGIDSNTGEQKKRSQNKPAKKSNGKKPSQRTGQKGGQKNFKGKGKQRAAVADDQDVDDVSSDEEEAFIAVDTSPNKKECYECCYASHTRKECVSKETKSAADLKEKTGRKFSQPRSPPKKEKDITYEYCVMAIHDSDGDESDVDEVKKAGMMSITGETNESAWTIDSGATKHMTTSKKSFIRYEVHTSHITVGGKRTLRSPGRGDIVVVMNGNRRKIRNVLYVPGLGYNLLSISALEKIGLSVNFQQGNVKITRRGTTIAVGHRAGSLYRLSEILLDRALITEEGENEDSAEDLPEGFFAPNDSSTPEGVDDIRMDDGRYDDLKGPFAELHARLGHPSKDRLMMLHKHVFGVPKISPPPDFFCDICENNKLTRRVRKYRYDKADTPGKRLFIDVWGKYRVRCVIPGIGDVGYFLSCVDEATGMAWIMPLKRRDYVVEATTTAINRLEREDESVKVQFIRCDNAKEFHRIESDVRSSGIQMEYTTAYTPEQNGTAERMNRTIVTMVRCMLHHSGLPDGFWPMAAIYACHLRNRLPLSGGATPLERWDGQKPLIEPERTFGMLCKVHIPKERKQKDGKLSPVAMDGIYMGVASTSQHRVYIPARKEIQIHTSVKVFERRRALHLLSDLYGQSNYPLTPTPMMLNEAGDRHFAEEEAVGDERISPYTASNAQTYQQMLNKLPRDPAEDPGPEGATRQEVVQTFARESQPTESTSFEEISPQRENLQSIPQQPPPSQSRELQEIDIAPDSRGMRNLPAGSMQQGAEISQKVQDFPSDDQQFASHTEQDGAQPEQDARQDGNSEGDALNDEFEETIDNTDPMEDIEYQGVRFQPRRSERQRYHYHPYQFDDVYGRKGGTVLLASANPDPLSYKEALKSPDRFRWLEATQKEIISLSANGTWVFVHRPKGRALISSKWVFKKKYHPSGLIDKYKARLVARGFTQKEGIDFEETFAPTLRYESLRLLFAIAIQYGLRLWLLDVVTAYLNGDLDKEIYMSIPEGVPRTKQNEGKVLLLKKGLYGLKQSGRIWARKFRNIIQKFGFTPIHADNCIFIKHFGKDICLLALYVDDIVIATKRKKTYVQVKEYLTSSFKITDSGPLTGILGIRISQNHAKGIIAMDQTNYVHNMLENHGMTNCKPVSTPMDGYEGIQPARDDEHRACQKDFQQLVGELMFLTVATRPDLAFAISKLSQFCIDPTVRHFNALTRVLKYLKSAPNLGLFFRASGSGPKHFTDAAYADDKIDRRSTYGYLMTNADAACIWYSRKQRSVATSTVEAEYLALSEGCKSSIWATRWMDQAGFDTDKPIVICGDNSGSIALSKNPEHHARSKHIDIQYHFVREKVQEGLVKVEYVSTKDQAADIMTKPLTRKPYESGRLKLGLYPVV